MLKTDLTEKAKMATSGTQEIRKNIYAFRS
jgi:hypothetical protein